MKLKTKLARLSGRGFAATVPSADAPFVASVTLPEPVGAARAAQLRARIEALRAAKPPAAHALEQTSGWLEHMVETTAGPLCQIITAHSEDFLQGDTAIAPCLTVRGAQLAALALDTSLLGVDSRRLLFVDTETTGLAGGAGTLPFLIGVGYFVDGALRIEQWMLRGPGQEVPMLSRLAECLAEADAIVTYNGKSFDWPLLRNRFILNRVKMPVPRPHLDLLHCMRRLLKTRVPAGHEPKRGGLRLTGVERDVLGFCRVGDIDGAHIPERYFAFLRGGPAALLDPVIEHNRHDLVSLAALLGYAGHRLDDTVSPRSANEHLNLATIAWRGQHLERAAAFAQRASLAGAAHVRAEAALLLGQMLTRQRQHAQAALALQHGLSPLPGHCPLQATLHLTLAKLFEHRLGDLAAAQRHALASCHAEEPLAQAKRLERLERKTAARLAKMGVTTASRVAVGIPAEGLGRL